MIAWLWRLVSQRLRVTLTDEPAQQGVRMHRLFCPPDRDTKFVTQLR
jgi:hypothetical protein